MMYWSWFRSHKRLKRNDKTRIVTFRATHRDELFRYSFEPDWIVFNRLFNIRDAYFMNIFLGITRNVNYRMRDLHKLQVLRLYLLHTRRGQFHALGKPVRGQRTWSNAWTAYTANNLLRNYIGELRRTLQKSSKEEKKDYRRVARKSKKRKANTSKKEFVRTIVQWF